jgi:DNA-binding CsgD family transcriptional regulator
VDQVLDDTLAGHGAFAVVEGPAGIGKSSLLAEARHRAGEQELAVLVARGTEIERSFSYGVVRQLFEPQLRGVTEAQRSELFVGAAAHASRLFDPTAVVEPAAGGEDAAFAVLHGLYWLTLNLAEHKPLLLVVDDLQWADAASTRWIAYLARRLEAVPAAVLAGVRPVEDEDSALSELLADPQTIAIQPSALSEEAVTELVRQQLGSEAEPAFCVACHRSTGGNPLLVHELVRTLVSEAVAPTAASVAVVERLAPDAVARSVGLRLARLSAPAASLARAIAILGDDVEGPTAAALAGIERRDLAPSAALLSRVALLHPDPPLRFVHPVVRNAVYESIEHHQRGLEHARAAALLHERGAPVEQIAAQLLVSPAEMTDDAVAILRQAGARAAADGAPVSAARYLERALAEPMDDAQRAELLLELAAAEFGLSNAAVVEHLREAVALLEDPEQRAVALAQLGRALYWAGDDEEGVRVLEEALAQRPDAKDDLQRRLEGGLIANATRVASQYAAARRRLEKLKVSPDDGPGARMLLSVQAYHEAAMAGDRAKAVALAVNALRAMPDEERAWHYTPATYALLYSDEIDEAVALLDPAIAFVQRSGAVFGFSGLAMMRAILEYSRGDLREAEADARTALEALPSRQAWFVRHAHTWLSQILVERGALDEAASLVESARATTDSAEPFVRTPLLRAGAVVAAARGDHRAALEQALELGHMLSAFGHDNPVVSYPSWRSLAAQAQHGLGDDKAALTLATEDAELARRWGAPRTLGGALRIEGSLRSGNSGMKLLREAVGLLEDSPARLEHAYALADLGARLRRDNQRAEARDYLRPALELAQRLGADLLATRAHEELIAAGARPRRRELSGLDSLTPSERRTAALAADGLSNREIAQALFVTLRTVEMHLSNVFRKLDVSSRTQLPALFAEAREEPEPVAPA